MKKQTFYLLKRYRRWVFLLLYLSLSVLFWRYRHFLIHQSISSPFPTITYDFIAIALIITGFICIIYLLRNPLEKSRFRRAVERAKIRNAKGEYPVLLSVFADPNKEHGKIYKVANNGISIVDFDENKARAKLEAALNGRIYRMDYARRTTRTLIYVMPRKYDLPRIISVHSTELTALPNFLLVGNTGSGKSYGLLTLLGAYITLPNVTITICDFKNSFSQFQNSPNFYGYTDVLQGIRKVYKEFEYRLSANDEERNKQILVLLIDEYGALVLSQEKKAAEELKMMVSNMLFMGRSLGIRILVGTQRCGAELYSGGARDQFKARCGLGELSREQKQMLFSDCKDDMTHLNGVGEGYLLIDGQELERIKIERIDDIDALNDKILMAMDGAGDEA